MNIREYLEAKYGVGSATTMLYCEAKALGVSWPLTNGWLARCGDTELTKESAERLEAALEERLRRRPDDWSASMGMQVLSDAWVTLVRQPDPMSPDFLLSKAWKRARYKALRVHGGKCQACGASAATGARITVDHIRPRRLFPQLALEQGNLQVLCSDCNEGKGNHDMTDWRQESAVP
jgi:HNH endonuclease